MGKKKWNPAEKDPMMKKMIDETFKLFGSRNELKYKALYKSMNMGCWGE